MHRHPLTAVRVRTAAALVLVVSAALLCRPSPALAQGAAAGQPLVWQRQARFTAITDNLVRLEWAADGQFADAPSAVVGRPQPSGKVTMEAKGTALTLHTRDLTITYTADGKPFSADNLQITWRQGDDSEQWVPGQPDPGNLGGTRHSLDGLDQGGLGTLPPGLLSRAGYFLYDDSNSPLWTADGQWIAPRPEGDHRDWYFCVYHHDYPLGLREWVHLTGDIPMLPRWAFGAWYSRYWPYTDAEEREIIRRFRAEGIPLDVLVIDVDWHLYGWESYDWNTKLFPDPLGFLKWVHQQGCKVTLNNHPGHLPAADSRYDEMLRRMGLTLADHPDGISINLADKRQADAYMEVLHDPMIDQGINFWWIDGCAASMPGLDCQMWTSKVYYDGTEAHTGKRSLIFARYGGPGSHRYPVGFSGDTHSQWGVLNFEIMFTATAGNVAYPYWSHDIGGFLGKQLDPELYIRWVEFGALSPVLRLHSDHGVREPWNYGPEALDIARKYFRLRYRLIPYLYSYSRVVHETGTPLVRPLYLEFPELDEAYQYPYEYLLGREFLIAPIGTPGDGGVTRKEIYLPPGEWFDYETGDAYSGPTIINYVAPLDRCPLFVRAGAIIPMQPDMDYVGQRPVEPLTLDIYPGASGTFDLYEDDGESLDYRKGAFATTRIEFRDGDTDQTVVIGAARGRYAGQAERRTYLVQLNRRLAPTSVTVGTALAHRITRTSLDGAESGWYYDRDGSRLLIKFAAPIREKAIVKVAGGAGRRTFAMAQRARRYQELTGAALRVARERNLPRLATALEGLEARARSVVSAVTTAEAGEPALARQVADLGGETARVWRESAAQTADPQAWSAAMAALLGLDVAAWVRPGSDRESADLGVRVSTALPQPGMTATLAATPPEGWSAGEPTSAAMGDRGSLVSLSLPVRRTGQRLPGVLDFGATVSIAWLGQTLTREVTVPVDDSYLQCFHLIGPFDNTDNKGFDTVYPPEKEIDFTKSYPGKGGEARWQTTEWTLPVTAAGPAPVFISLVSRFEPHENVVAYSVTYLWSPDARDVVFSLGSDDGCALWVNGDKLFSHPQQRGAAPGQDHVPARLRAGWNTVMMKIAQLPGDWGFYLQVTDPDGTPMAEVRQALNPEA
jgi:hypothetical protein